MAPALSCHRKQMKLLESFPGNGWKFLYHDREPEPTMHDHTVPMAWVPWLMNQKVPIYSAGLYSPRTLTGITKKKRADVAYWGFALEHSKVRHRVKNILVTAGILRQHSFTESSLRNWKWQGAELSQHPAAASTRRVSTGAFPVAGIKLNIQGWAALGSGAQVAKMGICNTGTK